MKRIRIFLILVLTVCTAVIVYAGDANRKLTLTLEDAISLAHDNSPEVQAARHTYRAAYWNYRSFRANYLPSVSLISNPYLNRQINKITQPDGTEQFIRQNMRLKNFQGAMIFDAGGHNQRGNKDIPSGPTFASKEWIELFSYALDEAKRLGLVMGFNIQSGWNLGGPCVTPQYAAKQLTYTERQVTGGKTISIQLDNPRKHNNFYKDIAVLAFPAEEENKTLKRISKLDLKMGYHELGGTQLVEAFKSTLDEVREADILMHVVDISHPNFEEQMQVVSQTLNEINASNKPVFVVFNKIDAYRYEEYDEFSLEPKKAENYTLDEFKKSWIAKENTPCIFISAKDRIGIDKLRADLYKMVAEIHAGRYPFNNFLW